MFVKGQPSPNPAGRPKKGPRVIVPSGLNAGRRWTVAEVEMLAEDPALLGHVLGKTKLRTLYGNLGDQRETVIPDLHSHWIRHIWCQPRGVDSSLMAHRGSYKTTAVSEVGVPFNWLFYPDDRVMLVRATFTAAASSMATIARNMKHPDIVSLFEYVHGKGCTETEYSRDSEILYKFKKNNTKEGSITSWGILQDFTGFHYDRVLGDDFISREDSFSTAKREKTIAAVNEIQTNIVDPTGDCHWNGTPWHKEDAWGCVPDALQFPVFARTDHRGIYREGTGLYNEEEFQKLIWGEKDGKRYRLISISQEAANYHLDPTVADSGALFANVAGLAPWQNGLRDITAHIDARFEGTDLTAVSIMARLPNGKIQATGKAYDEHLETCAADIIRMFRKYKVRRFTMERNRDAGFGAKLIERMAKEAGLSVSIPYESKGGIKVPGYHETQNKVSKITTYGLHHWPDIIWDTDCQELFLDKVVNWREGEEPDDPADTFASHLREFYSDIPKSSKSEAWKLY